MEEQTLRDLSRDMPNSDEANAMLSHMGQESDRGLALLSGALVEMGLFWAIYRRMPDLGTGARYAIFDDPGAPLATCSAKIKMGFAMGIYGEHTKTCLEQINAIRNAFAHALRPLDFAHPTIAREVGKIEIPDPIRALDLGKTDAREAFRLISNGCYAILLKNALDYGVRHIETRLP